MANAPWILGYPQVSPSLSPSRTGIAPRRFGRPFKGNSREADLPMRPPDPEPSPSARTAVTPSAVLDFERLGDHAVNVTGRLEQLRPRV